MNNKFKVLIKGFALLGIFGLLSACGGSSGGGGGGTPAPFAPDSVTGLSAWFEADALTGFVDNDPVGTWPDSSGNGNDASQATGGAIPLYKSSLVGGKPGLLFDGNDLLTTADVSLGTFSIFVVFNSTNAGMPITHGQATTGNGHWIFTSFGCSIDLRRGGVFSGKDLTSNWGADGVFRIASHTFDGTHAGNLFYLNGAAQSLVDCGTPADPGTTPVALPLGIGARVDINWHIAGGISEVIVYDRALNDTERGDIENYLNAKYTVF